MSSLLSQEFIFSAMDAEKQGEVFPIDFDEVWGTFGFGRKTDARRTVSRRLTFDKHYTTKQKPGIYTNRKTKIFLSTEGFSILSEAARVRKTIQQKCFPLGKHLYLIASPEVGVCKIGIANTPQERLNSLQVGFPFTLEIWVSLPGCAKYEKILHEVLADFKLKGEWFDISVFRMIDWETFDKK